VSYKKLKHLVDLAAANLKKAGVRPGERVAIMLPNCPQTVITYWACLKIGAVVVMTNPSTWKRSWSTISTIPRPRPSSP
jgi:Acyl-CoA synthetases (AMP-forming)/AMP-acid ligases II